MNRIDLAAWWETEGRISADLRPVLGESRVAPLWRAINVSIHILYSSCAQHGVAGPCSHTEDEHVLMWLGGRVLTNTLATVRLLVVGYYGPAVALIRDSVETTMLLGLFDAAPEELATWRGMGESKERWKAFSPRAVMKKLIARNAWHRYEDYDLYTAMAGHPTPNVSRLFVSSQRQRRMVGPFADAEVAEKTLHATMLAASHGAYQMADLLKVQDRFKEELRSLNEALEDWSHPKQR